MATVSERQDIGDRQSAENNWIRSFIEFSILTFSIHNIPHLVPWEFVIHFCACFIYFASRVRVWRNLDFGIPLKFETKGPSSRLHSHMKRVKWQKIIGSDRWKMKDTPWIPIQNIQTQTNQRLISFLLTTDGCDHQRQLDPTFFQLLHHPESITKAPAIVFSLLRPSRSNFTELVTFVGSCRSIDQGSQFGCALWFHLCIYRK